MRVCRPVAAGRPAAMVLCWGPSGPQSAPATYLPPAVNTSCSAGCCHLALRAAGGTSKVRLTAAAGEVC